MTNVYGTPEKRELRRRLFEIGLEALAADGWTVRRPQHGGGASVRVISKPGVAPKQISIRTTQDRWIAFPRNRNDNGWVTLSDVDAVLAVSVDDKFNPTEAKVHLIDGDEMRRRFDRAYAARQKAQYAIPLGRGVWVSLYDNEAAEPPTLVGAGAGNQFKAIATVSLNGGAPQKDGARHEPETAPARESDFLTIAEAKRRLALTHGVPESNVKITIEG